MYVKLSKNISATATVGQVLQEIVKICTGVITQPSQLTVFDNTGSQIINSVATNWELIYPLSFTASTNTYVLRSQCVNTGKYKYARFVAKGVATNEPFVEPAGGTANVYSKLATSSYYSIELTSCTGVNTSTGVVTNVTPYYTGTGIVDGYQIGNSVLYLSITPRSLVMYFPSFDGTIPTNLFCVFEFPENGITTSKNLIPVLAYRGNGYLLTAISAGSTSTSRQNICQIPDGYDVTTLTSNTRLSADSSFCLQNFDFNFNNTASTILADRLMFNTTDRKVISRDLLVYDYKRSHSAMNASTLCGITFIPTGANTSLDYTYSKDGITYACWPLYYGCTLLVQRV